MTGAINHSRNQHLTDFTLSLRAENLHIPKPRHDHSAAIPRSGSTERSCSTDVRYDRISDSLLIEEKGIAPIGSGKGGSTGSLSGDPSVTGRDSLPLGSGCFGHEPSQ